MNATETIFCESCGKPNAADARFCEHCGAAVADAPQPTANPGGSPVQPSGGAPRASFDASAAVQRIDSLTPGASELAARVTQQMSTPAATAALIAGAVAAAAVFGIAVLAAAVISDQSLIGAVDNGKGVISAGFAQMLNFLQVGYSDGVGKLGPALFLVFPIGACALAAANQAHRTRSLSPATRLLAGAGTGLVFGLLMLIPALATGSLGAASNGTLSSSDPNVLGAVLLGVLWGCTGGLIGAYYAVRRDGQQSSLSDIAPRLVTDVARTIAVAVRPLAVVLVLMTVTGAVAWMVQTSHHQSLRGNRSTLVATVDSGAYAVEDGVHWAELGALVQFRPALAGSPEGYPVPANTSRIKANSKGEYRLFGLKPALHAYTFIPLLIWLIGIPLLLALNAGFAVARLRGAATPLLGAAWGALVGPIWAISMVIVNALVAKDFFGRANGSSVLGMFLLGGLVLGAVGGFLSVQARQQARHSELPTAPRAV